jgi:hypothetical protein
MGPPGPRRPHRSRMRPIGGTRLAGEPRPYRDRRLRPITGTIFGMSPLWPRERASVHGTRVRPVVWARECGPSSPCWLCIVGLASRQKAWRGRNRWPPFPLWDTGTGPITKIQLAIIAGIVGAICDRRRTGWSKASDSQRCCEI